MLPRMPVSSKTSRTAASSGVSPASTWPLGSDQISRPRRSRRAMSAAWGWRPVRSSTNPPAEVSSTRCTAGRRGVGFGVLGIWAG